MDGASKAKKKRSQGGRPTAWQFFPIYGLRLEEDDGLFGPLWGDATLVSRNKVEALVRQGPGKVHPLLAHGKVSEALDQAAMESIGNTVSLVEIQPEAYIAVRPRNTKEASRRRADRVRALLNATMFLRGMRGIAFCGEAREYAWFLSAGDIVVQHGKPPKASIRPFVNPSIVQRWLSVSKKELRESVKRGTPISIEGTDTWDLHQNRLACRLLTEDKHSKFRERLIGAALLTQDACCTPSEFAKLQMAVTALERLLNTSNYQLLERRAKCFFSGDRPNIRVILEKRNQLTHEGRSEDEQTIMVTAREAVACAWTLFDIAVAFSEHFNGEEFDKYVDALASAYDVDSAVRDLTNDPTYSEHVKVFHESMKGKRARVMHLAVERAMRGKGNDVPEV